MIPRRKNRSGRSRRVSFHNCRFRCSENCDSCCRRTEGVQMTLADINRIGRQGLNGYFKKNNHLLFPYRLRTEENKCILLSTSGKCLLYDSRPLLCRLYPFQINFSNNGDILWCIEHCPGFDEPKGLPINAEYLNALEEEMKRLEGDKFFDNLKKYVLNGARETVLFSPICHKTSYAKWETKERFREIIEKLLFLPEFEELSMRGRLECIIYDLWPKFKNIIGGEKLQVEDCTTFISCKSLEKAYKIFRVHLLELCRDSVEREKDHLARLEKNGKLVSAGSNEKERVHSKISTANITGYDGRRISVDADKLMRTLPFGSNAKNSEEAYFCELLHRNGKFGGYNVDLTVDCELFFLFLTADSLELKANAFALEKQNEEIGEGEMKEAIWIIERMLGSLLKRAMAREPNRVLLSKNTFTT